MDISLIENEMTNSGIDVKGYKKTNLLHICQIPDPGTTGSISERIRQICKRHFGRFKTTF